MTNIPKTIEKKVYVRAGFTESQRTKNLEKAKTIFSLILAIVLSSCASPANNVRTFSTKTIVEECRGISTKEEGEKFNFAVKILDEGKGINTSASWNKNVVHDALVNSGLEGTEANIKVLELYYECRNSFYFTNENNKFSTTDKSPIDDKFITVEGNPKAIPDKSWFFGVHHNDWTINYAVQVTNRSPYAVKCHYKISSCPFDESSCTLSYDMHIESIGLEKGSARNFIGEFDFNYDNNLVKTPPIYSKIDCTG